jgi:hypothetical protein
MKKMTDIENPFDDFLVDDTESGWEYTKLARKWEEKKEVYLAKEKDRKTREFIYNITIKFIEIIYPEILERVEKFAYPVGSPKFAHRLKQDITLMVWDYFRMIPNHHLLTEKKGLICGLAVNPICIHVYKKYSNKQH